MDGIICCIQLYDPVLQISRSYLKNAFWPNIFVGASFQILDIQKYACGLKLGPAAILNQNPIFEITSGVKLKTAFQVFPAVAEIIGLLLAVFQVISQVPEA